MRWYSAMLSCSSFSASYNSGAAFLNFSFHSPSLAPGHTPYVRDRADLQRFHDWWTAMLDHLDRLGVRNASIAEILDNIREA